MLAFTNTLRDKAGMLACLEKHIAADQLVRKQHWKNGKGCSAACLYHEYAPEGEGANSGSTLHGLAPSVDGIPSEVSFLHDAIFEGLPEEKAINGVWTKRYCSAIQPGADLSLVTSHFMVWLLQDELADKYDADDYPAVKEALGGVITLYKRRIVGDEPTIIDWKRAAEAALVAEAAWAADAAWAAARDALVAAEAARAAAEAVEAVEAAARAAADAARAAAEAAWAAAEAARAAAEAASYQRMADKLIELLEAAPCPVR